MIKDDYIEVVAVKIAVSGGVSRSFLSLPSSARDGSVRPLWTSVGAKRRPRSHARMS